MKQAKEFESFSKKRLSTSSRTVSLNRNSESAHKPVYDRLHSEHSEREYRRRELSETYYKNIFQGVPHIGNSVKRMSSKLSSHSSVSDGTSSSMLKQVNRLNQDQTIGSTSTIQQQSIMTTLQTMSTKSKQIMAKRLEEDFLKLLVQNGWSRNTFVPSDDCKKVIIYLGFVGADGALETKLLIELCKVLTNPRADEEILLDNVLKCLKAIMNLDNQACSTAQLNEQALTLEPTNQQQSNQDYTAGISFVKSHKLTFSDDEIGRVNLNLRD